MDALLFALADVIDGSEFGMATATAFELIHVDALFGCTQRA
jgi:hypothetical protein